MTQTKDLNWLSAPAFFLIVGMIAINTKTHNSPARNPVKVKTELAAPVVPKPS
jgi:hypothetical protein